MLMVIAVIAILAAILLPVFSRAKQRAQGIQCVNNLHQMTLGWQVYTDENGNRFPPNAAMGHNHPPVGEDAGNPSWVAGVLTGVGTAHAGGQSGMCCFFFSDVPGSQGTYFFKGATACPATCNGGTLSGNGALVPNCKSCVHAISCQGCKK